MKEHVRSLLEHALAALRDEGELALDSLPEIVVERSRGDGHGDFASPVALALARAARRKPREIAERIVARMPESASISSVAIAGPGFINFHAATEAFASVARRILVCGARSAHLTMGQGRRIQVEFVSANPTGPLHVGHGRGAAYGASVANILEAAGFDVQREYYVNDAGRQMHILALSVWLRYLERLGTPVEFPSNGYRGEYIHEIAAALQRDVGGGLAVDIETLMDGVPADEPAGGDKEAHVDALIARARLLLGSERYEQVYVRARETGVHDIRSDLEQFGVVYDEWFSERGLVETGDVGRIVTRLRERGHVYERDGALWFRSTAFGDTKDRVVVRENGESTYFASDIAYAANKFERGFERAIYVWGADHHGYIARVKAAVEALGYDRDAVEILIVQFANLYRGGQRVQMSDPKRRIRLSARASHRGRRGRCAVLLRDAPLRAASRLRSGAREVPEQRQSRVLRAVCARADFERAATVCRAEHGPGISPEAAFHTLVEAEPLALMRTVAKYPEVLESAARALEPHQLAAYLREVATQLHAFYNAHTFLVDDDGVRGARLSLAAATRAVLADGLALLGVSAPEAM